MNIRSAVAGIFGNDTETPDALTLIHSDHQEVSALFTQALGDDVPAAQRRTATAKICRALTVHAQMEEALFYPALRRAGKQKERDSVLEAAEEHGVVKDLIAKIQALPPRDETLKAKLTVLKESVEHHVREEESEIFAEARSVLGRDRLAELGAEMLRFKERALRTGSAPAARRSSTRKSTAQKAAPRKKSTVRKAKRR